MKIRNKNDNFLFYGDKMQVIEDSEPSQPTVPTDVKILTE